LTSEQKEISMKKKHERDLERENVMLVFKITAPHGLSASIKFKIDMNAK
jgi:hypothetical protein